LRIAHICPFALNGKAAPVPGHMLAAWCMPAAVSQMILIS
jgi:hypothetical protein